MRFIENQRVQMQIMSCYDDSYHIIVLSSYSTSYPIWIDPLGWKVGPKQNEIKYVQAKKAKGRNQFPDLKISDSSRLQCCSYVFTFSKGVLEKQWNHLLQNKAKEHIKMEFVDYRYSGLLEDLILHCTAYGMYCTIYSDRNIYALSSINIFICYWICDKRSCSVCVYLVCINFEFQLCVLIPTIYAVRMYVMQRLCD